MAEKISRKVAVFVIRKNKEEPEILLINHPNTDYQFPAGTIKKREDPEVAARREVEEETGLEDGRIIEVLEPLTIEYEEHARLIRKARVYSGPSDIASRYGRLRKGLKVKVYAEKNGFVQVRYRERDNLQPDRPVMLNIRGWIKAPRLARKEIRYFYVVRSDDEKDQPWTIIADHHRFTLEWHPLEHVLNGSCPLAGPQQMWFDSHKDELKKVAAKLQ